MLPRIRCVQDAIQHVYELSGPEGIKKIEESRNATFVLESCTKDSAGIWINRPCLIFYAQEKHPEGSQYFAIVPTKNGAIIMDGITATEPFMGIIADDGKMYYSRYRWDAQGTTEAAIDGGRDYCKIHGRPQRLLRLQIQEGKLYEVEFESANDSFSAPTQPNARYA